MRKLIEVYDRLGRLWQAMAIVLCLGILPSSCRSPKAFTGPTIEFTHVPPAAQGGRERVDTISGRVVGARPGQRIVIFAKSGPWWVQPDPDHPYITVQQDSTWSSPTHLGYEYAALLVDPAYQPQPTTDSIPTIGGAVATVATTKGSGSLPPNPTQTISFAGYDWKVRTVSADAGGGLNNQYDAANAQIDANGYLHLRISKKSDHWTCAAVSLGRSLGYGTYVVSVSDVSHLEPPVAFTMRTYDEQGGEYYRQIQILLSRWGDAKAKNDAQYGVLPTYVPGNTVHFSAPSGSITFSLHWEPGRATIETFRGSMAPTGSAAVSRHVFTSGVPTPGKETFDIMLFIVPSKIQLQHSTEVVVEKFEYLPE